MNKNGVILVLAGLVLVGSIWGSVANKKKILLEEQLFNKDKEIQVVQAQNNQVQEQVLAKTADLQKVLQEKENKLLQKRDELVNLRKTIKGLEAKLSVRSAVITKLSADKRSLNNRLQEKAGQPGKKVADSCDNKLSTCQAQLQVAEKNNAKLKAWLETKKQRLASLQEGTQVAAEAVKSSGEIKNVQAQLESSRGEYEILKQRLAAMDVDVKRKQAKLIREADSARAQVIGLEKIIEEKNNSIEDTGKELDRYKINMDVLLARIAEQQDSLRELQGEAKELVKQLADKNAEIADLNEKLLQTPVK